MQTVTENVNNSVIASDEIHVFADAVTGKIRGWCVTHPNNKAAQPIAAGEVCIQVSRVPNLSVDKYVDIATGEMRAGE